MTEFVRLLTPHALLPDGWAKDVRIEVDDSGIIAALTTDAAGNGDAVRLDGPIIPGMANLHSHAFQRAMAGLAERRGGEADSFWTWREAMYRFVSLLEPEHIEAIAAQVYVEMMEAGYTAVAEFHYLHHDRDGRPYATLTETSRRIVSAAETAGLRLTLLPVLYAQGGFGGKPLAPEQRRFGNNAERFQRLNTELQSLYRDNAGVGLGLALHSLRAVTPDEMRSTIEQLDKNDPRTPIHVHVAEQTREVEECLAFSGRRPVEWLFEQTHVDQRWCLVHATHVNDCEIDAVTASGAVAGLCPTTEANLGDGLFPAETYMQRGGRFGIGSDSHISVSPQEELKLLEYGQRLSLRRRAVLASEQVPSVGRSLYQTAARGGAQALGIDAGEIRRGARADFVVMDAEHPALYGKSGDALLDAAIFAAGRNPVKSVWVAGKEVVSGGEHPARETVFRRFKAVMKSLSEAL